MDWGDKDLELAIIEIRKRRTLDLVVFGHTHHSLRRSNNKLRETFLLDKYGTAYLNSACVPRRGKDVLGNSLCHFSWIEFTNGKLTHLSHRWFLENGSIAYEEKLLDL